MLSQYVNESYAISCSSDSAAGVGYLLKDRVMAPRGFAEAVMEVARGGWHSTPRSSPRCSIAGAGAVPSTS